MEQTSVTRVKDIYVGKPDARDEFDTAGSQQFIEAFVMPPNFDLEGLLSEDKCFITGYKGTGKTALLLYLEHRFKERNEATCTSFILFKSDYRELQRLRMSAQLQRIVSTMVVDREHFMSREDFSYLWRWHLFRQIIEDNERCNGQLFADDEYWQGFKKLIDSLIPLDEKGKGSKFSIGKLTFGLPLLGGFMTPQMDVTFNHSKEDAQKNIDLIAIIDAATEVFRNTTRTDVPYYIFIDELEAFYGTDEVFKRDLRLIRDLLLETKELNILFTRMGISGNTKIICSARSEIINSINRFVTSKELNKVTSGFDCPLIWDYNTTNAYSHPIMEILLKRIELSEQANGVTYASRKELCEHWFPERVNNGIDPVSYILNNSWCKPRDIVRLLSAAKNCLHSGDTSFTQAVFESSLPQYSRDSLDELREELRALYAPEEIDDIFRCLTGYYNFFSVEELKDYVRTNFPDSILLTRTSDILTDLYRLGIIGNIIPEANRYRWQYRGEQQVILTGAWKLVIHRGIAKALSIVPRKYAKKAAQPVSDGAQAGPAAEDRAREEKDPLLGARVVLTELQSGYNGGVRGVFGAERRVGTISRSQLNGVPVSALQGREIRVQVLQHNHLGGSYSVRPLEDLAALAAQAAPQETQPKPAPEKEPEPGQVVVLTELQSGYNGGVRGVFGAGRWAGTISAKRLGGKMPADLLGRQLRVRVVERNPNGNSYSLEPVDGPGEEARN